MQFLQDKENLFWQEPHFFQPYSGFGRLSPLSSLPSRPSPKFRTFLWLSPGVLPRTVGDTHISYKKELP